MKSLIKILTIPLVLITLTSSAFAYAIGNNHSTYDEIMKHDSDGDGIVNIVEYVARLIDKPEKEFNQAMDKFAAYDFDKNFIIDWRDKFYDGEK
ncbi:hypothetical protein GOV13_05425 [Candidatus Pacearchaeota archaeon]|nr:hypothetical protein [Candidatus Pacearchaeota archaeon]